MAIKTRAPFSDYSQEGLYYITICTFHREPIFGHIENHSMMLSPEGIIVQEEWNKSFEIRKELFCDTFIIMPNHLHAILRIENIHAVETHNCPWYLFNFYSILKEIAIVEGMVK